MITIDQLLESVDLDFEPRWVTKDANGNISFFANSPIKWDFAWATRTIDEPMACINHLKLAEFSDKDWQECIYEVPRKTTGEIEKLTGILTIVKGKRKIVFPQEDIISKLHEVIDAVNELKGGEE
jgi:hypothetical protein